MFYPTIKDETVLMLNVVVQNIEKNPSYLSSPDCPYSDVIKKFFQRTGAEVAPVDLFAGEDELVVIDTQIAKIINDLEAFGVTLTKEDVSEKLAYFKTKTVLFEKLISMRERTFTLKELNEFRSTILGFMNEICTKDQVTDLMLRLDGALA
ncbi:hypothetical protein [Mesorhizobium sp. STM 4661]|uniref:hypothetical protein n=1 Tax=Mesorhizobium sp. STM 4661 TaxID=1297570 RepID=UPI0002BEBA74|nr:hypothetical protein [Mesorhizobium sp. STM 4661]CCV12950.1 hypothetical protein MESS4_510117 [Mesorhizobium sp. STM 4661]